MLVMNSRQIFTKLMFAASGAVVASLVQAFWLINPAQAAIVAGKATGTWNNPATVSGLTAGDTFTADFTYDDSAFLSAIDTSIPGNNQNTYQVALNSLIFKSGSVTQSLNNGTLSGVSNSNAALGSIVNIFGSFSNAESFGSLTIAKIIAPNAVDSLSSANFLRTIRGSLGNAEINAIANFSGSSVNGIQITGVSPGPNAAIPTPSLLFGVIGMGIRAWRSQRQRQSGC
jgi:hypothetical protein